LPAASLVPAYPVAAWDAGRLLAPYVPRPTPAQPAADALDLLFGGGGNLLDDVREVPFASDGTAPFDAGPGLSPAGEDAAPLDQVWGWLSIGGGGALTDTADDLGAGALHPAAAGAMLAGLVGFMGGLRGDRSRALETRTWRPFRA